MTDQELFKEFLEFKAFKERQSNMDMSTYEPEKKKSKKFIPRRRAKGTGSIYSIGGNRRKPWVASVTLGYDDDDGHQIKKLLGTFKTQQEAQNALSAYELQKSGIIENNSLINMKDIDKPKVKCPTFKEIWDIIFNDEISKLSYSSTANYSSSFKNLKELHNVPIDEINLHTLQPIFDKVMEIGSGKTKLNLMKVVCSKIFNYGLKYDYINKDYSSFISFESTNEKIRNRVPFTKEEIKKLLGIKTFNSKLILTYIFTGLRPQELLNIKSEDVHLDKGYMVGGLKTKNGIDRIIPIHNLIKPFIQEFLLNNRNYLIYDFNSLKAYNVYRVNVFKDTMDKTKMIHDPYDTRHTFATLCDEYGLNEYLTKKMLGHSSNDLTKDVYTHASIERLVEEINKITIS